MEVQNLEIAPSHRLDILPIPQHPAGYGFYYSGDDVVLPAPSEPSRPYTSSTQEKDTRSSTSFWGYCLVVLSIISVVDYSSTEAISSTLPDASMD